MLEEIENLDELSALHRISGDEACRFEITQHLVDIAIVRGKNLDLDLLRAVFEASFPVGHAPKPGKHDPSQGIQLQQLRVLEEARLDVP